jgi:beta-glucosidase
MKKLLLLFLIWPTLIFSQDNNTPIYKNPHNSPDVRAKDLLAGMTEEEKIAQLMSVWGSNFSYSNDKGELDHDKLKRIYGKGVNSVQPSYADIKETVEVRNIIQKYLLEETRLGIPALFVDEGLHGLMRPESTVFPQSIGLACSWNPELVREVYDVVAREMRSRGTTLTLSPVIDITRDPRWGRVEETYGEDPYLSGLLGAAAVTGFQGTSNGIIAKNHVGATLKHFCGHGEPEGGINQAPANISVRTLYETHFAPFKTVIEKASPMAVMPSYNEIDGIPSHANKWLLKDVLVKEFGFKGLVVSDYYGINQLKVKHFIANDKYDMAELSFNAGVHIELPNPTNYKVLPELIKKGRVSIEDIDAAVYLVLKYKFELGLFYDSPIINIYEAIRISKLESSRNLALKAAQQSIVLLKNDGILPLSKNDKKKIAVIGPNANSHLYGGYSGSPYQGVSLLEGLKERAGKDIEFVTAQGVILTKTAKDSAHYNWSHDHIEFPTHEENLKLIKEAMRTAKSADLIILAIGENEQLCREAFNSTHHGDNMTLDLISDQQELADSLLSLGKPVIIYLQNGRPLSINQLNNTANAIIEGWYMGQEGGLAAADIIFGDINPSGKLTITFPTYVGQLPIFYNHKNSAQFHDYISGKNKPLYPFGYGLSYTTFDYSDLKLESSKIKPDGSTTASITVTNTGKVKGDEIVQLYIRDEISSVTRPVKELKDFRRITLNAGESKVITFTIDSSKLSFWNIDMNYVVEPGTFKIMVGRSSEDLKETILTVI